VGLSEYERRMWVEIEARLVRECRTSPRLGRAARCAAKIILGSAVAVLAILLAVIVADATLAVFAVAGRLGMYGR
jgi:hypothetical protein